MHRFPITMLTPEAKNSCLNCILRINRLRGISARLERMKLSAIQRRTDANSVLSNHSPMLGAMAYVRRKNTQPSTTENEKAAFICSAESTFR